MRRQENDIERKLDLVIMNSVLWDVNRWGPNFVTDYKKNLVKLLDCVKSVLAEDGMFIWLTAQPGTLIKFQSRIYLSFFISERIRRKCMGKSRSPPWVISR